MPVVVTAISVVFQAYEFLLLARVFLSWINTDPYRPVIAHPIVQVLQRITDPVLVPLRRVIPPIGGTIDITPVVALLVLEILRRIITAFLLSL